MSEFVSAHKGRVYAHVLPTQKFRTRQFALRLVLPMSRETVTPIAMLPYLLTEGTKTYPNSLSIQRKSDELFGAVLRSSISKRGPFHIVDLMLGVPDERAVDVAKGVYDEGRELLNEILFAPVLTDHAFPETHMRRERALHERRLESILDDKMIFANERCIEETARGDAAGLPRLGFLHDVRRATGKDVYAAYEMLLGSAQVHVYAVGDFPDAPNEAEALVEYYARHFPNNASQSEYQVRALAPVNDRVNYVVDQQDVGQGKLNLGYKTGTSYQSKDYIPMQVMNGVFGGFPHSKLFMNVRERESLAYYASSRLDGFSGILTVQTGIEFANYEKTLAIVDEQVKALQAGNVTDQELDFTKSGFLNQYRQVLDQPFGLMDIHFQGVLTGRVKSLPELMQEVATVRKEDVVAAAASLHLDTVYFLRNKEEQQHA